MRYAEPDIAGLTELAVERLLESHPSAPIALLGSGHLVVEVDPSMLVRVDAVSLIGDGLRVRRLPRRLPGGAELGEGPLAIVDGRGKVIFAQGEGRFHIVRLRRDRCYFREDALWVADASLHWEVGVMPGSRSGAGLGAGNEAGELFVRVSGDGVIALRCAGDLVAVKVSPERAQRVFPSALLGWIGDVVAIAEPGHPYLRCEGEGAILLDLQGGARHPDADRGVG